MQKIIAIQANSVDSINIETDTTFLLALEAQKRSYQIYWYETKDLSLIKGKVYAKAKKIFFFENSKNFFKTLKYVNLDLSKTKYISKETKIKNLCMAGGVALNCVANGKILKKNIFENIWFQPAAGDAGGSLGAALAFWYQELGNKRKVVSRGDEMKGS